jgi:hypothetical protein
LTGLGNEHPFSPSATGVMGNINELKPRNITENHEVNCRRAIYRCSKAQGPRSPSDACHSADLKLRDLADHLPLFIKLPTPVSDVFNLITVGLSIVIIVSSLLQYSSAAIVNAEQHHRSGLEINEQRRLLALFPEQASAADLQPFAERYNAIS